MENLFALAAKNVPSGGIVAQIGASFFNLTFVFIFGSVLYSVAMILMDSVPKIPGISDAANRQTM